VIAKEDCGLVQIYFLPGTITVSSKSGLQGLYTLLITPGKKDTIVRKEEVGDRRTLAALTDALQPSLQFLLPKETG
jgi:hypothetical protein